MFCSRLAAIIPSSRRSGEVSLYGVSGMRWSERGAALHVRQRRRIRSFMAVWEGGLIVQFLQTTLLQRRHSPTMSRAHLPTFPRVIRPEPELPWLSSFSTDLTLLGIAVPASSISATVSIYSFSQRRVSRTSWCRKGARFTRNWRHVRDKACKVLRSTARAISLTTG